MQASRDAADGDRFFEGPRADDARVTIVVPVFNCAGLTERCLLTLAAARPSDPPWKLVVIDNGSTDSTPLVLESLAARLPDLEVIRSPENLGFARACNLGARRTDTDYLLFLNNDTEVEAGWLAPLVEVLDGDPQAACASGKLLYPDGTIQHAGVLLAEIEGRDPMCAVHVYAGQPADLPAANEPRCYQALSAACLLVRRRFFEEAGAFDEGFYNGYEDVDLCLRFGERGWRNVYQPASRIVHHESKSGAERFRCVKENVERLHRRWLGRVQIDVIVDADGNGRGTGAGRVHVYRADAPQPATAR